MLRPDTLSSTGYSETLSRPFEFDGTDIPTPAVQPLEDYARRDCGGWQTPGRIIPIGKRLYYKRYFDDFPVSR